MLAQPGLAQEVAPHGNGGLGWLPERESHFRERFAELLFPGSKRDRSDGWSLAMALGRPAVPLLWDMVRSEPADANRRLTALAAALVAGGPGEDARVASWLEQDAPMLRERVLVCMVLALGPQRSRPMPGFWLRALGPGKEPQQLLQVAARLAAARFPEATEGTPPFVGDDPGIAAANAFAGLPVAHSVVSKWGSLRTVDRHAELFRRGLLLGAARRYRAGATNDAATELARELLDGRGDPGDDLRAAAIWWFARSGEWRSNPVVLDQRWLRIAMADSTTATAGCTQLSPRVSPRDDAPRRLAVAYALHVPVEQIVAERAIWGAEDVRSDVALALAWRLLGTGAAAPIATELDGCPEWGFVRFASGGVATFAERCEAPALEMAANLCREGRIPRATLRDVLEQALWSRGSHPGLEPWLQERLLVRDLLLSGSNWGGKYQPHVRLDLRYLPTGLDRKDDFFPIACDLFDFLLTPRLPIPPEHRLGP